MAYDEATAERVRKGLGKLGPVTEKKMFGGLCLLVGGNMTAGVTGDRVMFRVPKEEYERHLASPDTAPMTFTGRPMTGMLYLKPAAATGAKLAKWLKIAHGLAASLPPK